MVMVYLMKLEIVFQTVMMVLNMMSLEIVFLTASIIYYSHGSINSDEDSDGVLNFDSDIFDFDNDGILNDNDISPYDNDDNDGIIDGLDDDISGIPYDHIFDISLNSDFNFVSLNIQLTMNFIL